MSTFHSEAPYPQKFIMFFLREEPSPGHPNSDGSDSSTNPNFGIFPGQYFLNHAHVISMYIIGLPILNTQPQLGTYSFVELSVYCMVKDWLQYYIETIYIYTIRERERERERHDKFKCVRKLHLLSSESMAHRLRLFHDSKRFKMRSATESKTTTKKNDLTISDCFSLIGTPCWFPKSRRSPTHLVAMALLLLFLGVLQLAVAQDEVATVPETQAPLLRGIYNEVNNPMTW